MTPKLFLLAATAECVLPKYGSRMYAQKAESGLQMDNIDCLYTPGCAPLSVKEASSCFRMVDVWRHSDKIVPLLYPSGDEFDMYLDDENVDQFIKEWGFDLIMNDGYRREWMRPRVGGFLACQSWLQRHRSGGVTEGLVIEGVEYAVFQDGKCFFFKEELFGGSGGTIGPRYCGVEKIEHPPFPRLGLDPTGGRKVMSITTTNSVTVCGRPVESECWGPGCRSTFPNLERPPGERDWTIPECKGPWCDDDDDKPSPPSQCGPWCDETEKNPPRLEGPTGEPEVTSADDQSTGPGSDEDGLSNSVSDPEQHVSIEADDYV